MRFGIARSLYRYLPTFVGLLLFSVMFVLYNNDDYALYFSILRNYGATPFRFPFLDISFVLASWECTRQGIDVIAVNPCDVLGRVFDYSPVWLWFSAIPIGPDDAPIVGALVDLVFLLSLSLLPPARRLGELAVILVATLSTTVVFAVERANSDVALFALAAAAVVLAERRLAVRLAGYAAGLAAALLKYYPIMILILVLRERGRVFLVVTIVVLATAAAFWLGFHTDIQRSLANLAAVPFGWGTFGAKNLVVLALVALQTIPMARGASDSVQHFAPPAIYLILLGVILPRCWYTTTNAAFGEALAKLSARERNFLVAGCAVIVGCFFAGQSIYYRAIFLLFTLPGFLAVAKAAPTRATRRLGRSMVAIILLLLWEEGFRLDASRILQTYRTGTIPKSVDILVFSIGRELAWWWMISVMLAVIVLFLRRGQTLQDLSSFFRHFRRWRSGRRRSTLPPD